LADGGKHLVEWVPVFYAPALSMALAPSTMPAQPDPPTVLAFGDPAIDTDTRSEIRSFHRDALLGRLPDAQREVNELRRFYGARVTVRTGAVAAEETLKRNAGRYDILHLATHGLLDEHAPLYSAVLLAGSENDDGLLEAREILSLPLHADLVVLSACDSARGELFHGEGVMSLSWAFLATGCPRVVASQWRVGSASAARLMIEFHRDLAKRPAVRNVAQALRKAQLEILRSRYYSHPYYWAGFLLVGRD
jgi:CHAT domain-containing protein